MMIALCIKQHTAP